MKSTEMQPFLIANLSEGRASIAAGRQRRRMAPWHTPLLV